jgi:hypothetical protein
MSMMERSTKNHRKMNVCISITNLLRAMVNGVEHFAVVVL